MRGMRFRTSIDYWTEFRKPKIIYQEIQLLSVVMPLITTDRFGNNKTFLIADAYPTSLLVSS